MKKLRFLKEQLIKAKRGNEWLWFIDLYLKVGEYFYMINERLESALIWCKKNDIESTRLKKFNRESKNTKKKQSKKKRCKFLTEKAKKHIQS